jgi:hypothetical protein
MIRYEFISLGDNSGRSDRMYVFGKDEYAALKTVFREVHQDRYHETSESWDYVTPQVIGGFISIRRADVANAFKTEEKS